MSIIATPNLAAVGSLNLPSFLPVPPLMNLIAEWAALIPLICHLASYRHAHQLAGQVTLLGRVSIGMFPKLGVLAEIAKLIKGGPEFLDAASTLSHSGRQVWDVKWGSRFHAANGAASTILAECVLKHGRHIVRIPEGVPSTILSHAGMNSTGSANLGPPEVRNEAASISSSSSDESAAVLAPKTILRPSFRRYQTLHILHFAKCKPVSSWHSILDRFLLTPAFEGAAFIFKVSIAIVLCLFGAYGTAATLFLGSVNQLVSRIIKVERPPEFLGNNEVHDACMLVATHQNASIWYLFVGDRGIVDSLLNKPMVQIPTQGLAAQWFKQAHGLQLLTMTFVAAQQGWDGVCLLILLIVSTIVKLRFKNKFVARMFCEVNGIDIKQESFEFSGRTCMLGAIQKISGSKSWAWMDEILVPCPRRDVWAKWLSTADAESNLVEHQMGSLSAFDKGWVLVNKALSEQASIMILNAITGLKSERV